MMDKLLVSPSPHIHAKKTTSAIMGDVCIALLPAVVVSILFYGWSVVINLGVSVLGCVLTEWLILKFLFHRDGRFCLSSSVVTGLLLALSLPSSIDWWIVLIGAVFAIGVVKMSFGGLGQNVFNPAIAARVFLLISFPRQMTDWTAAPGFIHATDAVSGATLLGCYSEEGIEGLNSLGYLEGGSLKMFFDIGGSVGEIGIVALLIGFIYLLARKVVKPWIPLSIFATIAIVSTAFALSDPMRFTGPVFNLLTGGVIMGACFMATDYVTSPMTVAGGIVFGIGIGIIEMMIRYFGAYPEGMSFAILIMNCCVPLIDRCFHGRKYGRA